MYHMTFVLGSTCGGGFSERERGSEVTGIGMNGGKGTMSGKYEPPIRYCVIEIQWSWDQHRRAQE